jgi:DNA-binding Xre family transcriptional regulator
MLTLEQVQAALHDRNLTKVADATGLHYDTVRRVYRGDHKQISYETIKKLSDYLRG